MAKRTLVEALLLASALACTAGAGESPRNTRSPEIDAPHPKEPVVDWRSDFESLRMQINANLSGPPRQRQLPWQREQPFYWDGAMPRRISQPPSIIPPSGLWIEPRPPVIRSRRSGSQSP